jgi:hypothetical protein
MTFSNLIRQTHRWLSVCFVASIVIYAIVMSRGPVPAWLNALPLGALFLMLATGLYLFLLPYVRRRGSSAAPAG